MSIEYKDLEVWKKGRELVTDCYKLLEKLPVEERFGLTDQIRRCVVSVPTNIAEGHGRATDKEFAEFLGYARGSLYELETELLLCVDLKYLSETETELIFNKINILAKMLSSLMRKIRS